MMREHSRTEKFRTGGERASQTDVSLLFFPGCSTNRCQASRIPAVAEPPGDPYTISVNVDMVVLHATVRNRNGTLVSGLGKEDFQVYEDGVLQQTEYFSHEDIPVTVGLVVDNSGSMRTKRPEVISAALAFARSSNPEDQMFVVSFNENVSFGLPETPFTDKAAQLERALSRIAADGMTALYDAVAAALEHLKKGNRDKKVLIVISDGGDNASKHNLARSWPWRDSPMPSSTPSVSLIRKIPTGTPVRSSSLPRPRVARPSCPGQSADVVPICKRIARDIRNQYSITYVPTNRKQDGTYRVIQVKAGAPDRGRLLVRTRAGYYAPLKPQPLPAARATDHEDPN